MIDAQGFGLLPPEHIPRVVLPRGAAFPPLRENHIPQQVKAILDWRSRTDAATQDWWQCLGYLVQLHDEVILWFPLSYEI